MKKRIMVAALASIVCLAPATLQASQCLAITKLVYEDTVKYSDQLGKQNLPWMNIVWLQTHLGRPKTTRVAANQFKYKWRCGDNSVNYFSVISDNTGALVQVEGQYSSDSGAAKYSNCFGPGCLQANG